MRRRRRFLWTIILAVISVGSGVFALSKLSKLPAFAIDTIVINGSDNDIKPSLEAAALHAIQGDYLGLFDKSNIAMYPKSLVARAVRDSSPRIQSVSVKNGGWKAVIVNIVLKQPAAVVCGSLPDWDGMTFNNTNTDRCYFADKAGLIFERATSTDGTNYNLYYFPDLGDATSSDALIGTMAATSSDFQNVQKFYNNAVSHGIRVQALLWRSGGQYELYASNPGNGELAAEKSTVVIYLNDHNDLDNEFANLVSFWNNMHEKARASGETPQFDSIDLRYGSNVFYHMVR